MAVNYSKTSPYINTETFAFFLDVANIPSIPFNPSDTMYRIDNIYQHRPDLLSYDLYGDSALWWVFSVRNPNTLQDPIYDFLAGTTIYIPNKDTLASVLGL